MKIAILAFRHSIDDARVVHREAASLHKAGHEVSLIFRCGANGNFLNASSEILQTQKDRKIPIKHMRMDLYGIWRKSGVWGRLQDVGEAANLIKKLKVDVIHVHEPDLATLAGIRAKKKLKKAGHKTMLIQDFHEHPPAMYAESFNSLIIQRIIFKLAEMWDRITLKHTDLVFTANSIVRGYVLSKYAYMPCEILYNCPTLIAQDKIETKITADDDRLKLVHEGSLNFIRGLREMVEAITALKDKVQLIIVGDVFNEEGKWLRDKIKENKLENTIKITGWLPYSEIEGYIQQGDIGLIMFNATLNNNLAGPPNKLFNYLKQGMPVISSNIPESKKIIQEENCGIVINKLTKNGIISSVERILDSPQETKLLSKNALNAFKKRYNWEIMEKNLLRGYDELK